MENILEVPEKTLVSELKAVFDNQKRAMSPNWVIYSLFYGIFFGLTVLSIMGFLLEELNGSVIGYSGLMTFAAFMVNLFGTMALRDKIIADMEAAKPFEERYGFRSYNTNFDVLHVTIVPTKAGELKFKSFDSFPNIQKKAGQLFDYYVFNDVKDLDKKDLSIFIAIPNDLD